MTSICEKNVSAEVRLIHTDQITLYKFHRFKKQVKQGILNQWEFMGFPKLQSKTWKTVHCSMLSKRYFRKKLLFS